MDMQEDDVAFDWVLCLLLKLGYRTKQITTLYRANYRQPEPFVIMLAGFPFSNAGKGHQLDLEVAL